MKIKLLVILIAVNFITTQLEIFLPFVSEEVNELALLIINFVFLLAINLIQQRPSFLAFDKENEDYDLMEQMKLRFDVQSYFVATGITLVVTSSLIIGKYAFGLHRESIYDIILLFVLNFLWAIGGMNWFET